MIRRWVGPNAAGAALVGVVLACEALAYVWQYNAYRFVPEGYLALPFIGGPWLAELHWDRVVALVAWSWFALMPLGRLITPTAGAEDAPSARRRPSSVIIACAAVALVVAVVAAVGTSWRYWGYLVSPPEVNERVREAKSVESLTDFRNDPTDRRPFRSGAWLVETLPGLALRAPPPPQGTGEWRTRAAVELARRGLIPTDSALPALLPDRMTRVFDAIRPRLDDEGVIGDVVEFTTADGRHALHVSVEGNPYLSLGMPLSHVPIYEFLFETAPGARGTLRLVSFERFYHDVGRYEGMGWREIFPLFGIVALIAFTAWAVIYLLLRRGLDRWIQQRQRGFPVEFAAAGAEN
jgi:hypothetical protein